MNIVFLLNKTSPRNTRSAAKAQVAKKRLCSQSKNDRLPTEQKLAENNPLSSHNATRITCHTIGPWLTDSKAAVTIDTITNVKTIAVSVGQAHEHKTQFKAGAD